jgi:guanylate kinase
MTGSLFVITAPSGAGKSSLIDALLKEDPRLRLSVSYTTRAPRPGEANGREYHFVDDKTFMAMLERGEFLESAEVHGYRYGTSQAVIREALARGQDLVLEIDWQGAQQVRKLHPNASACYPAASVAELSGARAARCRCRTAPAGQRGRRNFARARVRLRLINKDFDEAGETCRPSSVERLRKARTQSSPS